MVRPIMTDLFFLSQKAVPATKEDMNVANDLLDTIKANADRCVGMAANMIGVNKTIMVALINNKYEIIINPKIIDISCVEYEAEEGCLALTGTRTASRRRGLLLKYYNKHWKKVRKEFNGFEAQIIQHELDHFNGIII